MYFSSSRMRPLYRTRHVALPCHTLPVSLSQRDCPERRFNGGICKSLSGRTIRTDQYSDVKHKQICIIQRAFVPHHRHQLWDLEKKSPHLRTRHGCPGDSHPARLSLSIARIDFISHFQICHGGVSTDLTRSSETRPKGAATSKPGCDQDGCQRGCAKDRRNGW